jgi:hypothetical protein
VIARLAAIGLVIAGALAFKIGRGEIVEIDRRIEIEQAAFACNQRCLDGGAMRMQLVEPHPTDHRRRDGTQAADRTIALPRDRRATDILKTRPNTNERNIPIQGGCVTVHSFG